MSQIQHQKKDDYQIIENNNENQGDNVVRQKTEGNIQEQFFSESKNNYVLFNNYEAVS
jgi:hypothetical protein